MSHIETRCETNANTIAVALHRHLPDVAWPETFTDTPSRAANDDREVSSRTSDEWCSLAAHVRNAVCHDIVTRQEYIDDVTIPREHLTHEQLRTFLTDPDALISFSRLTKNILDDDILDRTTWLTRAATTLERMQHIIEAMRHETLATAPIESHADIHRVHDESARIVEAMREHVARLLAETTTDGTTAWPHETYRATHAAMTTTGSPFFTTPHGVRRLTANAA